MTDSTNPQSSADERLAEWIAGGGSAPEVEAAARLADFVDGGRRARTELGEA